MATSRCGDSASVMRSRHPDIAPGEILFGYFPMATHLVIEAGRVDLRGLRDVAAHRQGVSPVYNSYARVSGQPAYEGVSGDYQALLRPLFMLSFLVDDYLAEADQFGAACTILSSASSKTAFGLAHLLTKRGITVIGLTSPGNIDFVKSLGCYASAVTYDDLASLDPMIKVAFVDMAGDQKVREKVHRHWSDRLVYSGRVGLTHQDATEDDKALPGIAPAWFFAPDQIRRRMKDWGPSGFDTRFEAAFADFRPLLERCLAVVHGRGEAAVTDIYRVVLAGRARPNDGHMLSLAD